jgi:hypothetical protein
MLIRVIGTREESFEKLFIYAEIPKTSRKESSSINAYGFGQSFPTYLQVLFVSLLVTRGKL